MPQLTKSLLARDNELASPQRQLQVLENLASVPRFEEKLASAGLFPLKPASIDIFQVNVGKMCNQTCAHCHVDAGPDRREVMSRETMEQCLVAIAGSSIETVDITGGAPELNPHFRWFVQEVRRLQRHIIVRCNLTIIMSNPRFGDLPGFFRENEVEVVSSLPFYQADRTDRQRGEGVFLQSIEALQLLNNEGYGRQDGYALNLVYNPSGAFMPASQVELERQFKQELKRNYNIDFNHLYCITNMPISRYLEYLLRSGNFERYMEKLVNAFNPTAAAGVMCRNTISVGWDGYLYDCDFNQMLELKVGEGMPNHVAQFDYEKLNGRSIIVNKHCFGCTAGAGSSCNGATA